METLSAFRPALRDLALVESLSPPGELDLPRSIGHVPAAYFAKRAVVDLFGLMLPVPET
jgi:hypothetical protein